MSYGRGGCEEERASGKDNMPHHTCKYVACTDPSLAAVTITGHDSAERMKEYGWEQCSAYDRMHMRKEITSVKMAECK